jgi:hypothetical protein
VFTYRRAVYAHAQVRRALRGERGQLALSGQVERPVSDTRRAGAAGHVELPDRFVQHVRVLGTLNGHGRVEFFLGHFRPSRKRGWVLCEN